MPRPKYPTDNKDYNRRAKWRERGISPPTRDYPERCEICGDRPPANVRLCLDHDHKTGMFRGWLCHPCNRGLGLFGDNLAALISAVDYLTRASQTNDPTRSNTIG